MKTPKRKRKSKSKVRGRCVDYCRGGSCTLIIGF